MVIEMRALSSIQPYAKNLRKNAAAVDAVAASIKEFGFRQPIVVDEASTIIAGDTRYRGAMKLGLETVPVHVAVGLSPQQAKAYRLADNAVGEIAQWDRDLLPVELRELQLDGFDMDLIGFDDEELARWMSGDVSDGLADPDEIPAPPDQAVTRSGDLIILGEHRLLCGDSGNPEHVDRLMDGATAHLLVADAPYNVAVEPRSNRAIAAGVSSFPSTPARAARPSAKLRAKDRPIANDRVADGEFARLLDAWFGNAARVLEPGRGFYVFGGYGNIANYPPALERNGLYFSQAVIWVKEHPVMNRKDFMGNHEWCFYGWREGAAHKFYGPNNATDVWSVKKVSSAHMLHLTEKPVELAVRAMQYSSLKGEHVLDLFGGSGSTLIGAEQTGRRAYLMELDGLYCDLIIERWEKFTGKKAERVTDNTSAKAEVSSGGGRK